MTDQVTAFPLTPDRLPDLATLFEQGGERGQGVAAALLDAAISHARASGAELLEAYPADTDGGRIPSAAAYKGTLSMFERAGFAVVARRQINRTTTEHPIVRLELASSAALVPHEAAQVGRREGRPEPRVRRGV